MDNVASDGSQTLLLGGWLHLLCLWGGGCKTLLIAFYRRPLCKRRHGLLPFRAAPVVGCVVSSTTAALKLLLWGTALPWKVSLTTSKIPGCVAAVRCVWPKRWQRLHCKGPFGATYVSTVTRKPESLVRERTFTTSGPRASDAIKCGFRGRSLAASWSRRPQRTCKTLWTQMPRFSSSSRTTSSGMCLPRFLNSRRTQRSSGREKVWKLTPLLPSRDLSALTVALNPSEVRGTSVSFSPLIWAESQLWHEARNQVRKPHVSVTPDT